jgi:hypothetical protein
MVIESGEKLHTAVINVLPREAVLDRVTHELDERRLVATDNTTFNFEVNEFGPSD